MSSKNTVGRTSRSYKELDAPLGPTAREFFTVQFVTDFPKGIVTLGQFTSPFFTLQGFVRSGLSLLFVTSMEHHLTKVWVEKAVYLAILPLKPFRFT
jgi:hypothetical protein